MMVSKRYSNSPEKSYIGNIFCFNYFSVSIIVFEIEWEKKKKTWPTLRDGGTLTESSPSKKFLEQKKTKTSKKEQVPIN